jgi:hypothetical protein
MAGKLLHGQGKSNEHEHDICTVSGKVGCRVEGVKGWRETHGTKGNSCSGESYEAAIPGVRLMDRIGKVVAQLLENGPDAVVVLGHDQLPDYALETASE